jgi:molybdopterin molybdotransferase
MAPGFREMIAVEEAEALLAASMPRYSSVSVPLSKAQGRILREPLRADRAQPPFHRVAMDGIALSHAAWEGGLRRFAIEGRQLAGEKPRRLKSSTGCLEAMTGAVLPEGADCVVPVEEIGVADGHALLLAPDKPLKPMQHVHRAGSDCAAGEIIVPAGVELTANRIGVAAAFGVTAVPVAYSPSVVVLATGDELVEPSKVPGSHQIRRSNPYVIEAALRKRHIDRAALLHVRDEPGRIRRSIEGVMGKCDVLVTVGGVSMGKTDHVPAVLEQLGVEPIFHKVRQKPGKPFWFGVGKRAGQAVLPVFALPGNPASVLVCLHRYVLPALRLAMGGAPEPPVWAVLEEGAPATGSLAQFRPVVVGSQETGLRSASWVPNQGSGDFSAWGRCEGFVELPAERPATGEGEALRFFPW